MLDKITIIGMGLIGSSIARNIMKHNLAKTLVAADMNQDVCQKVIELQIAHQVTDQLREAVKDTDMVILCVAVGAMAAVG